MVERKESNIAPFVLQFREKPSKKDEIEISGMYNGQRQIWEWPNSPDDPTLKMSSPQTERPPTICNLATRVGNRIALDPVIDD